MAKQSASRLTGVALLLAAATLLAGCSLMSVRPVGSISAPPAHGYGGIVVNVGAPFTDAFENLQNHGDTSIVIIGFELIDTPEQVELVDVLLAGDQREGNVQWEADFPPMRYDMGPLVPAIGAELKPIAQQSADLGATRSSSA